MTTQRIMKSAAAIAMIAIACAFQPSMASGLRSSVNTTQVRFGDQFELRLTADSSAATAAPDLTPLREHFQILGTGQSSRTNIINGRRSDSFSWVITLTPNEKGRLTIPAITAGNISSDPVTIEVVDAGVLPTGASAAGEISIDVTVDPGTHYVQEEIPLTVRIDSGAAIRQATLQEPSSSDFILTQTGEDQASRATRNGREIAVIERHYLLKPQKSGAVTLPPLRLQATLDDPSGRSSIFDQMGFPSNMMRMPFGSSLLDDMFNSGRAVTVRSKPLTLEIKPRPTGDDTWFLPAKRVELRSNWSPTNPKFRVGEAVTRTIQLFALGASKEQLPDIPVTNIDGAQLYLDRTNDDSADTPEGTAAIREFTVSIVPTRAGEVSLPAIDVKWWDTSSDTERVASLPAQIISVAAGAGVNAGGVNANNASMAATTTKARTTDSAPARATASWAKEHAGWIVLLSLAVIALIAGALLMIKGSRKRNTRKRGLDAGESKQISDRSGRDKVLDQRARAFVQACKANDLHSAYSALSGWITAESTKGGVSPALAGEFAAMERQLYAGADNTAWHGKRALTLFIKEKQQRRASSRNGANRNSIPALYPA